VEQKRLVFSRSAEGLLEVLLKMLLGLISSLRAWLQELMQYG
jgi:hypothetical protein